jgi:hypothetical protein
LKGAGKKRPWQNIQLRKAGKINLSKEWVVLNRRSTPQASKMLFPEKATPDTLELLAAGRETHQARRSLITSDVTSYAAKAYFEIISTFHAPLMLLME